VAALAAIGFGVVGAVFLAVPKCLELLDGSIIEIDKSFVSQIFE